MKYFHMTEKKRAKMKIITTLILFTFMLTSDSFARTKQQQERIADGEAAKERYLQNKKISENTRRANISHQDSKFNLSLTIAPIKLIWAFHVEPTVELGLGKGKGGLAFKGGYGGNTRDGVDLSHLTLGISIRNYFVGNFDTGAYIGFGFNYSSIKASDVQNKATLSYVGVGPKLGFKAIGDCSGLTFDSSLGVDIGTSSLDVSSSDDSLGLSESSIMLKYVLNFGISMKTNIRGKSR